MVERPDTFGNNDPRSPGLRLLCAAIQKQPPDWDYVDRLAPHTPLNEEDVLWLEDTYLIPTATPDMRDLAATTLGQLINVSGLNKKGLELLKKMAAEDSYAPAKVRAAIALLRARDWFPDEDLLPDLVMETLTAARDRKIGATNDEIVMISSAAEEALSDR